MIILLLLCINMQVVGEDTLIHFSHIKSWDVCYEPIYEDDSTMIMGQYTTSTPNFGEDYMWIDGFNKYGARYDSVKVIDTLFVPRIVVRYKGKDYGIIVQPRELLERGLE